MNLRVAIALSGNNKAEGINDKGQKIIVQQRYQGRTQWLHSWHIADGQVVIEENWEEDDTYYKVMSDLYKVDVDADYWRPI
jgi:hypothetical protein